MSYYADDWLTILLGGCREVMAAMEPESVQTVVTSPPYWGLRDYGTEGQLGLEPTPEAYVAAMVEVFREVRRVLRSDGTVWLNLGDSYASTGGERTYGSSDGGTGRGPGTRRYRNVQGTPDSGMGLHDVGAQAVEGQGQDVEGASGGGQQGQTPYRLKPKDLVGIPWRVAFALQADGWYLRSDIIWSKPNPMPESVTDRPTKSHEYLFLLAKSPRYYFDADAVREPHSENTHWYMKDAPAPSNVAYQGQPSNGGQGGLRLTGPNPGGRNIRSVWTVATQPYPGAHFATFPPKLIEPCIKAGCPEGGWVLDPFAGSGTTGLVANRLGRRAVLIDLNADYLGQVMERAVEGVPYPLGLETA